MRAADDGRKALGDTVKLESIAPGNRVFGIAGEAAVEILSTRTYGPDAV